MQKMVLLIAVLISIISHVSGNRTAKLTLRMKYENRSITFSGDQCAGGAIFDNQEVSCVCITGLWIFYEQDCSLANVILGATGGQCFNLEFRVRKASLLSPPDETPHTSSATAFDKRISSIGGKFVTAKGIPFTRYFVPSGFPVLVTTGQQTWRIPSSNICIKPLSVNSNLTSFCLFKHSVYNEYQIIDEDCKINDSVIAPLVCTPYLTPKDADDEACVEVYGRRTKRSPGEKLQGRVDLGAVTGLVDISTAWNDENGDLNVTIDRPIMNSEIWNFMTYKAQLRLGIRDYKTEAAGLIAYSPAFEFLEVAKQIQQKACPDHYVPDDHYDISVGAFESIQKNHFRYMDQYLDFATSERIMDALHACLDNITTYPFLERFSKTPVSCNGSEPIVHGSYEMFDKILQLNLGPDQTSRFNEPIVETVWKIFFHAHSACFKYFEASFNDHHRFTTVMLPLFTNEINDMWFSVQELTSGVYSGFLGDAVDLMDSVAYCASFSRLETTYPWDLPRPRKDNARRKREISDGFSGFECMDDYDARNVCPFLT